MKRGGRRGWLRAALCCLGCGLCRTAAGAEGAPEAPQLAAVTVAPPPVIDGALDDPCWSIATHVEGFYFSQENRPETERTEAWICVDSGHVYAAFYCHDSNPETILAQQTQRGGMLDRDDYVSLHIDSTRRLVDHYSFRVSANGTQHDTIPDSGSGNIAWRGDWRGAARRVPDGYTVEMAIPYAILRYPRGQTAFGIAFGRNLEREEEGSIWPVMHDRFEERLMAVLAPLDLPPQVNRPTILPYAIFRADGDGATVQSGLDVKHTFANGTTALFTANPDFANVEDVVDTIAFSYTPRFLGETRPFFAEGSGLFPDSTALNTRRIPDVAAGLKTFARIRQHEYGAFAVLSDHSRIDGAFDYTFQAHRNFSVGTGMVYHDGDEQPTNLVSASHISSFHPMGGAGLRWGGAFHHSFTSGPGGEGNAWNASVSYSGNGRIGGNASYVFVDPTFIAVDGYVPEPDQRGWSVGISSSKRTQGSWIWNHSWYLDHSQRGKSTGALLQRSWSGGGNVRFANGTSFNTSASIGQRPPFHDWTVNGAFRWGLDTLHEEGGLSVTHGERGGGNYFFARLDQGWAPLRRVRLSLVSEYTQRLFHDPKRADESRTQNILTATGEIDAYSSVSLRFIERDGDLNLFLAYRHAPPNGRGIYLFFGDPNAGKTQTRFQVKLTWPF